jgi:hypothetical protein
MIRGTTNPYDKHLEISQYLPDPSGFTFELGCEGCADKVTVLSTDMDTLSTLVDEARTVDVPFCYGDDVNSGGAGAGRCAVRDMFFSEQRQQAACPNAVKLSQLATSLAAYDGLLIEQRQA